MTFTLISRGSDLVISGHWHLRRERQTLLLLTWLFSFSSWLWPYSHENFERCCILYVLEVIYFFFNTEPQINFSFLCLMLLVFVLSIFSTEFELCLVLSHVHMGVHVCACCMHVCVYMGCSSTWNLFHHVSKKNTWKKKDFKSQIFKKIITWYIHKYNYNHAFISLYKHLVYQDQNIASTLVGLCILDLWLISLCGLGIVVYSLRFHFVIHKMGIQMSTLKNCFQ